MERKELSEAEMITEVVKCSQSAKHFCFNYIKTENIETGKIESFGTFDAPGDLPDNAYRAEIEKLVDELQTLIDCNDMSAIYDLLIDKSRQVYATQTMSAVLGVWAFLFRDNWRLGITSKLQDDVDMTGNPNSLFMILRGMIGRLPSWLQPAQDQLIDNYMLLSYKLKNSSIIGSASDECFRNSQLTCAWMDEFAYQPHSYTRYKASREARKKFSVYTSTPKGKHNKFAELRFGKSPKVHVKTLGWWLRRSKDWYKDKCDNDYSGDDEGRATELDISYEGSLKGRVFKYFSPVEHVRIFSPNELIPVLQRCFIRVGIDFGLAHASVFIWIAKTPENQFIVFDELAASEGTVDMLSEEYRRINATWGLTSRGLINYADPAGHQRHLAKNAAAEVSVWDIFTANHIPLNEAQNDVEAGIVVMNSLFARGKVLISAKCTLLIDALNEAVYNTNKNGEVIGTKYKESEFSDMLDGFRYSLTDEIRRKLKPKDMTDYKPDSQKQPVMSSNQNYFQNIKRW
jgi:hypothetical protein